MKHLLIAAAALAATPALAATNLITNGGFSAGDSGFTSQYTYSSPGEFGMMPEGRYSVVSNAQQVHSLWADVTGFGGSGNFMVVNGATSEVAGESRTVWEQTVNAAAATNYFFQARATNVCCIPGFSGQINPSNLTFSIIENGVETTLDTFTTDPTSTGVWALLTSSYTTTTGGAVTLRLTNSNLAASGNDFGVDNISFSTTAVPEPATWAMLIAGFGMVGFAMRRRGLARVAA